MKAGGGQTAIVVLVGSHRRAVPLIHVCWARQSLSSGIGSGLYWEVAMEASGLQCQSLGSL